MSHKFLCNASLHEALFALDVELARACRQSGCWSCGHRLHVSNYPRKPHGVPPPFREHYAERLSFTCAKCRCRCTPPSVRFFGRIRFVAGLPILIAALTRGPSERRCRQLERCFGVQLSVSTWQRWRSWWRELPGPPASGSRPKAASPNLSAGTLAGRVLLRAFPGWLIDRLLATLRFLSPLTGGALRAV